MSGNGLGKMVRNVKEGLESGNSVHTHGTLATDEGRRLRCT